MFVSRAAASVLVASFMVALTSPAASARDSFERLSDGHTVEVTTASGAMARLDVSGPLDGGRLSLIAGPVAHIDRTLSERYEVAVSDGAGNAYRGPVATTGPESGIELTIPFDASALAEDERPVLVFWGADATWQELPAAVDASSGEAWLENAAPGSYMVKAVPSRGPVVAVDLGEDDASALWDGVIVTEGTVTGAIASDLESFIEGSLPVDVVVLGPRVAGTMSEEFRRAIISSLDPAVVWGIGATSQTGLLSGSSESGGALVASNPAGSALAQDVVAQLKTHTGRSGVITTEHVWSPDPAVPSLELTVGQLDHNFDAAVLSRRTDLYAAAITRALLENFDAVPATQASAPDSGFARRGLINTDALRRAVRMGSWDGGPIRDIPVGEQVVTGTFSVMGEPEDGAGGNLQVLVDWDFSSADLDWSEVADLPWQITFGAIDGSRLGLANVAPRSVSGAPLLKYIDFGSVVRSSRDAAVLYGLPPAWNGYIYFNDEPIWHASWADTSTGGGGGEPTILLPEEPTDELKALFESYGLEYQYRHGGDPVNLSTGNMAATEKVFSLTGVGDQVIDLALSFNGGDGRVSQVGASWNFAYGARAQQYRNDAVLITTATGGGLFFDTDGAGGFVPNPGANATLAVVAGGVRLTRQDGTTQVFEIDDVTGFGTLVEWTDRQGNSYVLDYGTPAAPNDERPTFAPLRSITDEAGQVVLVESSDEGRITAFVHPDGRRWELAYDGDNLVAITDGAGRTRAFSYNDQGLMVSVTGADGVVEVQNTYDAESRVVSQRDGVDSVRSFAYASDGTTTVTDSLGNESVLGHNDDGFAEREVDAEGGVTLTEYDDNHLPSRSVDARGNDYVSVYDAMGRVTSFTNAAGETTRYEYNSAGDLTAIESPAPDGSAARTEFVLNDDGRAVRTVLPDGTSTDATFDDHGDTLSVTDANGNTMHLAYDARGNVTSTTDALGFETVSTFDLANRVTSVTDARGGVTSYTWDTAGNLVKTVDAEGGVTASSFDPLSDALLEQIDPLGRATTYEYNANLQPTVVHFPDGTAEQTFYDSEHRATRMVQRDGTEVAYEYDGLGRQVSMTDPLGQAWATAYDATGNPTRSTDPSSRATVTTYDALGRPVAQTDALGHTTRTEYNPAGLVAATTDAAGFRTSYTYDAMGRVLATTYPDGATERYSYDAAGNVVVAVDQRGLETTFEYDANNRSVLMVDAKGSKWFSIYDEVGNLVNTVAPRGAETRTEYDLLGRPTKVTDPMRGEDSRAYDAAGQLLRTADALGRATTYEYDAMGNVLRTVAPDGTDVSLERDQMGRVVREIDERGQATSYAYDALGRQVSTTDAAGANWATAYDVQGNIVRQTDPRGGVTVTQYDAAYRVVATVDAEGNRTEFARDARGLATSTTDPVGAVTAVEFDAMGRPVRTVAPDGGAATAAYDAAGNLIATTDARGFTTSTEYDAAGLPVSVTDPAGGLWITEYDGAGDPVAAVDPLGRRTETEYDLLGRPVTVTDALGGTTSTSYDAASQVLSVRDALDRETAFQYDARGRVTAATHPDGTTEHFSYFATGELAEQVDQRGLTAAYEIDELGRVTLRTDTAGHEWFTSYDALGNVVSQADPRGAVTAYEYDAASGLIATTDAEGGRASFDLDARGLATGATDALGNTTTYGYDAMGRVASMATPDGAQTAYGYDLAGNLVLTTDPRGFVTATEYDALGRPVAVADAEAGVSRVEYDAAGNAVATVDATGARTEAAYDALGRVVRTTDAEGGVTRTRYDAAGQVTAVTDALGRVTEFSLDPMGRVTEVTHPDGTTDTSTYDAAGNLVASVNQRGDGTALVVDALGRVTARTDEAGETWRTEYDAAGNTVAEVDPLGYRTEVAYDLLGRPTAATDATGATTHTSYDAVGGVATRTDALGHEWQYTYDAMSRVLTAASPEGAVTSYAYDASGNQARVQNARGFAVETVFDGLGRPVRVTDPDAGVTTTGYDAVGRVTDVTDANGAVESWVYDGLGRTVQHVDGEGFATDYAYDAVGNLLTETGPRGGVTAYEYDGMNRPESVVDAEDETTQLSYDEAGNVASSTDPVGVQTRFVYDPRQLLILTVENADLGHLPNSSTNVVTQTAYDARGDVVAVTDPRGNRTEYVRDGLGRVVEATDAAGRVTGTGFDAAGRMVSETHADGATTEYGYSPDGYLTQTQYPDQTVTYAVDVVGNRTTMTDAIGTSAWEFDWANRVVSDTDAHGNTHSYTYDGVGNQVRAEFADGRVLERTFDGRGLTVSQSGPDGVTGFAYDGDGNLTQTTRPSGVVTTTQFDLVDRATSIVHAGGTPAGFDGEVSPASGAPGNAFGHCNDAPGHVNQEPTGCWTGDLSFTYDYDDRGLVTQRTVTTDEGATVADYTHDALGRLTRSVTGDYTATYGWDAASNLVAESVSDDVDTNLADDGWVIDRDVNEVNQVITVVTDGRLPVVHTLTESLTYDARGNRTGSVTTRTTGKKTHDLARVDYTFDGMNQLVGVLDFGDNLNNPKDDVVTQWSRDGLGRGLTVTEDGVSRVRVFDGTALIVDGDTRVTLGPDGRVLSEAFETVEGNGKNATEVTVHRDVLTDLLGSAVGVAQDGIVDADLTWFGDFGDTLSAPEWDTVTSFTGHVETAGLVEFATRTYDPASRVWVQEDSFTGTVTRASSLNRYAYVEGSPVSHTDVLGAFRAAAAMAAQKLSAAEYAAFIAQLTVLAVAPVCVAPSVQGCTANDVVSPFMAPRDTVIISLQGGAARVDATLCAQSRECRQLQAIYATWVAEQTDLSRIPMPSYWGLALAVGGGAACTVATGNIAIGSACFFAAGAAGGLVDYSNNVDPLSFSTKDALTTAAISGALSATAPGVGALIGKGTTAVATRWPVLGTCVIGCGNVAANTATATTGSTVNTTTTTAANSADDLVNLASPARASHILDGEVRPNGTFGGGHRAGTGFPGKSEFPAAWSDSQVMHNISDVATDSSLTWRAGAKPGDFWVNGTRDGIDIEVLIRNNEIWTGYPTNVARNP